MGLDMYLYAEKYIGEYEYETTNGKTTRKDNLQYDRVMESAGMLGLPTGGGATVTKCVAYWRKANAVHGWIVRNLADGVDTCQRIELTREDMVTLRNVCVEALKERDKATPHKDTTVKLNGDDMSRELTAKILDTFKQEQENMKATSTATENDPIPPTGGFFFGSTEKDEWYYDYLAETIDQINSILASDFDNEYSYYYQASW